MTIYTYREEALIIDASDKERWQFSGDIEVTLSLASRGRPAQLYGPPENCYPAEPAEWDVESICLCVMGQAVTLPDDFEGIDTLLERAIEAADTEGTQDD